MGLVFDREISPVNHFILLVLLLSSAAERAIVAKAILKLAAQEIDSFVVDNFPRQ
jgi:hypothetical protein